MELLLGGGDIIQNGAVGTATLELRGYGSEGSCIETFWEEGRPVWRFKTACLPWIRIAKMLIHRIRQYTKQENLQWGWECGANWEAGRRLFVLESSAVAALTPFWVVLAMLYKIKPELVGEKNIRVWSSKMTKNEVSFKMQLYENKMRKPVLLLVSIMRCSYKSLMIGKRELTIHLQKQKLYWEIFFSLDEKCATPFIATAAITCIGWQPILGTDHSTTQNLPSGIFLHIPYSKLNIGQCLTHAHRCHTDCSHPTFILYGLPVKVKT